MGKIRDLLSKYAKKAFQSSSTKTEEVLGKMFPSKKVSNIKDMYTLRSGTPTKYSPPSKSKRTKSRKRK